MGAKGCTDARRAVGWHGLAAPGDGWPTPASHRPAPTSTIPIYGGFLVNAAFLMLTAAWMTGADPVAAPAAPPAAPAPAVIAGSGCGGGCGSAFNGFCGEPQLSVAGTGAV